MALRTMNFGAGMLEKASRNTADQPEAVDVAVADHIERRMLVHQVECPVEAWLGAEAASQGLCRQSDGRTGRRRRIAAESAEEDGDEGGLPWHEYALMREEAGEYGGRLALCHAADEDGDQAVLFDSRYEWCPSCFSPCRAFAEISRMRPDSPR